MKELVKHLNDRYAGNGPTGNGACHNETLVLGGYSQGADVIGWTLRRHDLDPAVRDNIGFVALYGDPKFIGNYNTSSSGCYRPPWAIPDLGCHEYFPTAGLLLPRWPYRPDWIKGRFASFCDGGDRLCNTLRAAGGSTFPIDGTHSIAYQGDEGQNNGWIHWSAGLIAPIAKYTRNALNPSLLPATGAEAPASEPTTAEMPAPPLEEIPPQPIPWNLENLSGDSGSVSGYDANVGNTPAAVMFKNEPYVLHYDSQNGRLRWGRAKPNWVFGTVDGPNGVANGAVSHNVGVSPAAAVFGGALHVLYYDVAQGNLRHAWTADGDNWSANTLDGDPWSVLGRDKDVGRTPALVVHGTKLHTFYYDATAGNLRHAWSSDGVSWSGWNLDGDPGSIGGLDGNIGLEPVAASFNGDIHVFYRDATRGNLRHMWSPDGVAWQDENLDGDPGSIGGKDANVGHNPSVVIYRGDLHVFYHDQTKGCLRHMWTGTTSGWQDEDLTGHAGAALPYTSSVGSATAPVVVDDVLHLFVYEATGENLLHLWDDTSGWRIENFDGRGGDPAGRLNAAVGLDPVALNIWGKPHVFYRDQSNGNLRHGWPW